MPDLLQASPAAPAAPAAPMAPTVFVQPKPPGRGKLIAIIAAIATVGALASAFLFIPAVKTFVMSAVAPATKVFEKEPPAPAPTPPPEPTAADRDLERYGAVNSLRLALASSQGDLKKYPDALEELVPKYLVKLPVDPTTGWDYHYINSPAGYTISFTLEEGAIGLSKGDHILTPLGFDKPLLEVKPTPPPQTEVTTVPPTEVPSNPLPPPNQGPDTDEDGLSDTIEGDLGTNPGAKDSDGDGLDDGDEVNVYKTSPTKADTDGDGFTDGDEVYTGFDPRVAGGKLPDTDADGLADIYETAHGYDPNNADMDKDGLADGDELRVFGTDLKNPDTDNDGFTDGDELRRGFDPSGPGQLSGEERQSFDANGAKYGYHEPSTSTLKK